MKEEYHQEQLIFNPSDEDDQLTSEDLQVRCSLLAFKTLKHIAFELLQNIYAPESMDSIVSNTKEYMNIIFPIWDDKSVENQVFIEAASELLHSLLSVSKD